MTRSGVRKTATATVTATSWDEARYDEPEDQAALAQAQWAQSYAGDLAGESSTRMLIAYTGGDPEQPRTLSADFVGMERFTGTLDGRAGSFVVELRGRHEKGVAYTSGRIVPDSGTGELAGLHGEFESEARDMTYEVTMSYAFEPGPGVP
jgi:hypothetical protein